MNNKTDSIIKIHDLELVANFLSIFCVSARKYQKLKGHFKIDSQINCFIKIKKIEIPAF